MGFFLKCTAVCFGVSHPNDELSEMKNNNLFDQGLNLQCLSYVLFSFLTVYLD